MGGHLLSPFPVCGKDAPTKYAMCSEVGVGGDGYLASLRLFVRPPNKIIAIQIFGCYTNRRIFRRSYTSQKLCF